MSDRNTSTLSRQSPIVGRAYARARIYGLLAHLLRYPDAALVDYVAAVAPEVRAATGYLGTTAGPVDALLDAAAAARLDELERSYQAALTLTYSPDTPAYEAAYVSSDIFRQTHEMADIAGFYRAFGLELGDKDHERVDHIAVELSFMQFLCLKEAYAAQHREEAHLAVCRDAQRAFLREHLLCWAPAFAGRLAAVGGTSVHGALGRALAGWLDQEARLQNVTPHQSYDSPLPPEPEPDFGCPAAATIPVTDISFEEERS